jgi:predicted secreted hydrolase
MNKFRVGVALAAVLGVAALGIVVFALWPLPSQPRIEATVAVSEALADDRAGFARALESRPFSFPSDHGPHPDFRTEWWYYTGNLKTAAGRHFGFQLTFFRIGLVPAVEATGAEPRASAWVARQFYLAHFAVTDTAGGRFHAFSRTSRDALGLAGASASPFRVWLEDWSAEGDGASARLRAADGDVALDLKVSAAKPPVAQGDRGLSRKGPQLGNASFYYSFTRMQALGVVRLGDETFDVSGEAWMDREWSTSALAAGVEGWDWFAVQLDDGRELMFYLLRRRDGTPDPFSAGTLVEADGTTRALVLRDIRVETLAYWRSPRGAVRYPARWRLTVPSMSLFLELQPRLADQELMVGTRYWEGAVAVTGSGAAGRPLAGQGYVELVGYAD